MCQFKFVSSVTQLAKLWEIIVYSVTCAAMYNAQEILLYLQQWISLFEYNFIANKPNLYKYSILIILLLMSVSTGPLQVHQSTIQCRFYFQYYLGCWWCGNLSAVKHEDVYKYYIKNDITLFMSVSAGCLQVLQDGCSGTSALMSWCLVQTLEALLFTCNWLLHAIRCLTSHNVKNQSRV